MKEQRYCANCRAELPRGAAWCEACGTDAPVIFDGKVPKKKVGGGNWLAVLVLILIAAGVAAWYYRAHLPLQWIHGDLPRTDSGPIHVVRQRPGGARRAPGAKLNEPEAVIALRRYLAPQAGDKVECVATVSRGTSGDQYTFDAVDSCKGTKLGRWRVDGKSGAVAISR